MTLAVAVVALAIAAQASAGGPTSVSNVYAVGSLTVPGVDTGLVLTNGMQVTVVATGTVCPFGGSFCTTPDGYASWDTTQSSYGGFVLPGAPAWGLVGRVGSGPWIQVGSGPTTLSGSGALVFAVNDDLFGDNRGSFSVTVSYSCWPGWGYGDKNHQHCGPPGLTSAPGSSGEPKGRGKGGAVADAARGNASGDSNGNGNGNGSGNGNGKAKGA